MKKIAWNDQYSLIAMIVLFVCIFFVFFKPTLHQDGLLYMAPARSLIIDGDLNIYNENYYYIRPGWNTVLNRKITGKSRVMIKYVNAPEYTQRGFKHVVFPVGNALSWLPAMSFAHLFMMTTGNLGDRYVADGFTEPYISILGFYSFLLAMIATWLAYRFLRHWYTAGTAFIALSIGLCAGNLIPFFTMDVTFSHVLDYILINGFLLLSLTAQKQLDSDNSRSQLWLMALWGLVGGWMIIVRYQDLFLFLFPMVILGRQLLLRQTHSRIKAITRAGVFMAATFIAISLQFLYWKILYGRWMVTGTLMGTGNIPSFNPLNPELIQMLFSLHHGLYSWLPLLLPATLFAALMIRRNRLFGVLFICVFLVQMYYNSSRTEWWNMGFSVRRFSGWTLFFMIGFAEYFSLIKYRIIKIFSGLIALFFIGWQCVFIINYYIQGYSVSIYNDVTRNARPFGNAEMGIIWPRLDLIKDWGTTLLLWISKISWLNVPLQQLANGEYSRGSTFLLVHLIALTIIGGTVYLVVRYARLSFRWIVIIGLFYISGTGTAMIWSDLNSVNITPYEIQKNELLIADTQVRLRKGQTYLGNHTFAPLDGLRFPRRSLSSWDTTVLHCILGVPAGQTASINLHKERCIGDSDRNSDPLTSISITDVGVPLDNPWGKVTYTHDWYQLRVPLEKHLFDLGDLVFSTSGTSDVLVAGISYSPRD